MSRIGRIISSLNLKGRSSADYAQMITIGIVTACEGVNCYDVRRDIEAITIKKASQNFQVTEMIGGNPSGARPYGLFIPSIWLFWDSVTRSFVLYGPNGTGMCRVSLQRRGSFLTSFLPRDWEIVAVEPYQYSPA